MSSITGSRHNCEQGQPKLQHSLPGLPQQRNHRGGAGKGTTTGTTPQGGRGDTMGWGWGGGVWQPCIIYVCVCVYIYMYSRLCMHIIHTYRHFLRSYTNVQARSLLETLPNSPTPALGATPERRLCLSARFAVTLGSTGRRRLFVGWALGFRGLGLGRLGWSLGLHLPVGSLRKSGSGIGLGGMWRHPHTVHVSA